MLLGNTAAWCNGESGDVNQEDQPKEVATFARQKVLTVVIGPEAPLVEGVADARCKLPALLLLVQVKPRKWAPKRL